MRTKKDLERYLRKVLPTCGFRVDEISREIIIYTGVFEESPGGQLLALEEDDSGLPDEDEKPVFGNYRQAFERGKS